VNKYKIREPFLILTLFLSYVAMPKYIFIYRKHKPKKLHWHCQRENPINLTSTRKNKRIKRFNLYRRNYSFTDDVL
jgi:hypothetical protein